MVTAKALNIAALMEGNAPREGGSCKAICPADLGDSGIAFVAQPQIPLHGVNWALPGKCVHCAKIGFEK